MKQMCEGEGGEGDSGLSLGCGRRTGRGGRGRGQTSATGATRGRACGPGTAHGRLPRDERDERERWRGADPTPCAALASSIMNVPGESTLRREFLRLQQENKSNSEALKQQLQPPPRDPEAHIKHLLHQRQRRIEEQKEERRRVEEVGQRGQEPQGCPALSCRPAGGLALARVDVLPAPPDQRLLRSLTAPTDKATLSYSCMYTSTLVCPAPLTLVIGELGVCTNTSLPWASDQNMCRILPELLSPPGWLGLDLLVNCTNWRWAGEIN